MPSTTAAASVGSAITPSFAGPSTSVPTAGAAEAWTSKYVCEPFWMLSVKKRLP